MKTSSTDRFWKKVDKTDTCWNWLAAKDSRGYGRFHDPRTVSWLAHRWAYTEALGAIPDGLHIDHLCHNKSCVRPDHLEAVTLAENNKRMQARKTHCPKGHEYSEENTYLHSKTGARDCKECRRNRARKWHRDNRNKGAYVWKKYR